MESRFIGAFSSLGSLVQQNYGGIYNSYDERVGIISEVLNLSVRIYRPWGYFD